MSQAKYVATQKQIRVLENRLDQVSNNRQSVLKLLQINLLVSIWWQLWRLMS